MMLLLLLSKSPRYTFSYSVIVYGVAWIYHSVGHVCKHSREKRKLVIHLHALKHVLHVLLFLQLPYFWWTIRCEKNEGYNVRTAKLHWHT